MMNALPLAPTGEYTHTKDIPRTTPWNSQGVVVVVVHPSAVVLRAGSVPQARRGHHLTFRA